MKLDMKKKLLSISALFMTGISFGQSLTQANEPTIGSNVGMYVCDSNYTAYENITGNNATWDYSEITGYPGVTKNIQVIDPTSTPNSSTFPSSTKAFQIEDFVTTYWNSTTGDRSSQGFVFEEPSMGTIIGDYSSNNEILMTYPFANGSTSNDTYAGSLSFTFNGQAMNPNCTGTANSTIDGIGTLILPDGSSVGNVIRYKMVDVTNATVNIIIPMNLQMTRTHYEYFNLAGGNLPIFIHSKSTIMQAGSSTPLADVSLVLSSVEPTSMNADLNKQITNNYKFFPNPSKGEFVVAGEFNENSFIQISDQSGRIIYFNSDLEMVNNVKLSNIQKGIYFMNINNNGKHSLEKIIIE